MSRVSRGYADLRSHLGDWFAAGTGYDPVIAARDCRESGLTSLWEVRAGFVGDDSLSCNGLAVVLRRGLPPLDAGGSTYRVDVYEPGHLRVIPPAGAMAGRISYAPIEAGFTYSKDPDATPTQALYEPQFRAMHHLLDFVDRDPADPAAVAAWAQTYEEDTPPPVSPSEQSFLSLLRGQLQGPIADNYDQRAA